MSNEIKDFFSDELNERMLYATHRSGLRVYVFPKKGFSKYYAIYGTEYGSIDREFVVPGENEKTVVPDGIAHFLEHKMFEQPDGSNAFDSFALTGASSNAFTSFNMTAYLYSCTDRFYDNLDILIDFVNSPYFTDENVSKEMGIIGQEIKMYNDDPEWRVFFNALRLMFSDNPVKIDIAGTVESISKIDKNILYKCYKTFYNPGNMILVLVGDVDIEEALDHIDKHLNNVQNFGEIEHPKIREPLERVKEILAERMAISQPMFDIGFKDITPFTTGEELARREVATEIILDALFGKSSTFYTALYSEGLIDGSFDVETELEKRYGFSLIGGESKDPEAVYGKVKERIKQAQNDGIDKSDIERSKKVLKASEIKLFNYIEGVGNNYIKMLFKGINPFEYGKIIDSVDYDDIMGRLSDHFDVDNCVLSVILPLNSEGKGEDNG